LLTTALAWLACAGNCWAHALGVEAKQRRDKVEVEAFYDDNTPARNARVTVLDSGNKTIAEGKTNDKGVWSFKTPEPGRYRITVETGDEHRAKTTLEVRP